MSDRIVPLEIPGFDLFEVEYGFTIFEDLSE